MKRMTRHFELSVSSADWIGTRHQQQDNLSLQRFEFKGQNSLAIALADGVGGTSGAREASQAAIKAGMKSILDQAQSGSMNLLDVIESANIGVRKMQSQQSDFKLAATTFTAAVVVGKKIGWISVGDSALLLHRWRRTQRLNADHSMREALEILIKRRIMTRNEADENPRKNELRSYLSGEKIEEIDHRSLAMRIRKRDKIVLCSDGLFSLSMKEISKCLNKRSVSISRSSYLIEICRRKALVNQDNCSVIVIEAV